MRRSVGGSPTVLGPNHPDTRASIYCLARNAALQGENDVAIPLLREAVGHGLPREAAQGMEKDVSFRGLQKDARFEELVSEIRQHDAGPLDEVKLSEPAWKGRSVTPKNSFKHLISLLHRFGRMRILSSAASPPKFSKPELKRPNSGICWI